MPPGVAHPWRRWGRLHRGGLLRLQGSDKGRASMSARLGMHIWHRRQPCRPVFARRQTKQRVQPTCCAFIALQACTSKQLKAQSSESRSRMQVCKPEQGTAPLSPNQRAPRPRHPHSSHTHTHTHKYKHTNHIFKLCLQASHIWARPLTAWTCKGQGAARQLVQQRCFPSVSMQLGRKLEMESSAGFTCLWRPSSPAGRGSRQGRLDLLGM